MSDKILKISSANYFAGLEAVGGKLTLTDSNLIFKSHSFNTQTGYISISLKAILSINKSWTKLFGIIPLFPNSFSVVTVDGLKHKFVVWGRQDWINQINQKTKSLDKTSIKNKDLKYHIG